MNSKILGGLRRATAVTALAGGLVVAGAAGAYADQQPIKAPDQGPVGPVTISGEQAGSDASVTVTTDGTTGVVSGRAHLESPVDQASGGVVHHDSRPPAGRDGRFDTEPVGFAGGVTGDSSSVDVVGTGRVGAEKHYYVQD